MRETTEPRETSSHTCESPTLGVAEEPRLLEEAAPSCGDEGPLFVLFHEEEIAQLMSDGLLRREASPR